MFLIQNMLGFPVSLSDTVFAQFDPRRDYPGLVLNKSTSNLNFGCER
jgi:hypothetical protein